MSNQSTDFVEVITDWQEAYERTTALASSEPLTLSAPLYKPNIHGTVSVVVGVYTPGNDPLALELPEEDYLKLLEQWITTDSLTFVVHDLKSWLKPVYERLGPLALADLDMNRFDDTYLLGYLIDPPERIEGEIEATVETSLLLENLVLKYLGVRYLRLESWLVDKDPSTALYMRLWEDARIIHQVWLEMTRRLQADQPDGIDLLKLYREVELPLIPALLDLEVRGIRVEKGRAARVLRSTESVLALLLNRIRQSVRYIADFNPLNPEHVTTFLTSECGIDLAGRSIDDDFLDDLVSSVPVLRYIVRYRKLIRKIDFLEAAAASSDGYIHATYSQCSVSTGRLAVRNPALQAISRNTRKLYLLPDKGHVLMEADYSQAEARLMAVLSRDRVLCAIFAERGGDEVEVQRLKDLGALYYLWQQNDDFHTITAQWVGTAVGRPVSRDESKTVMYAISYGMSPESLALKLRISPDQAVKIIEAFFFLYSQVKEWKREVIEDLVEHGKKHGIAHRYLPTPMGRRRMFDRSIRDDPGEARRAVNFLLQGQVADLIKQAQVQIYGKLLQQKMKSRIILQLHDALYLSVAPDEVQAVEVLVKQSMERFSSVLGTPYTVCMTVDIKVRTVER